MGAVVRNESEIKEALIAANEYADTDSWNAAWAEALEWVLS